MNDTRRKMASVALTVIAVVIISVYYSINPTLFGNSTKPITTFNTSVATSTSIYTSIATTSTTESTASPPAIASTTTATRTTNYPPPVLDKSRIVPFDPDLKIEPVQTVLSSNNMTLIAERLASALGELPVTPIATYSFRTAKGSWINMTDNGVSYYTEDWRTLFDELFYYNGTPNFNYTEAKEWTENVISALGLSPQEANLVEDDVYGNIAICWDQRFPSVHESVHVLGNLEEMTSVALNQHLIEFDYYPPTSKLFMIEFSGLHWYHIPDNFPLKIDAQKSYDIAADYAENSLKLKVIPPYGGTLYPNFNTRFVVIQGHLYYLVPIWSSIGEYWIIVNSRTGEVGMPATTTSTTSLTRPK